VVRANVSASLVCVLLSEYRDRPPHGGRGLKHIFIVRGKTTINRPPHGGRGLKPAPAAVARAFRNRPPHGGRGLKHHGDIRLNRWPESSPTRGARIETPSQGQPEFYPAIGPPHVRMNSLPASCPAKRLRPFTARVKVLLPGANSAARTGARYWRVYGSEVPPYG